MITGEKEMSENKVKKIQNGYYTGERPLFHGEHLEIGDTIFGEGESPLKESSDITLKNSMFQWKYPLWYSKNVVAQDCTWAEMARAGVWYTDRFLILNWQAIILNCTIESLQGMCYIDNLVMKNCKLLNTTLAFEYSTIDVEITDGITSVMNPASGMIRAQSIDTLIPDPAKTDPAETQIVCDHIGCRLDKNPEESVEN